MNFTITKPAFCTDKITSTLCDSPPKQISIVILHTYILFIWELFWLLYLPIAFSPQSTLGKTETIMLAWIQFSDLVHSDLRKEKKNKIQSLLSKGMLHIMTMHGIQQFYWKVRNFNVKIPLVNPFPTHFSTYNSMLLTTMTSFSHASC